MPKKKKSGKKKGNHKKSLPGNETPAQAVKRLLKTYERNCQMTNALMCPSLRSAMKAHIEDDTLLSKVVIEPVSVIRPDDPAVSIEPLLMAFRQERYTFIKSIHVWDIPLQHKEVSTLALLLEKSVYAVQTLELMDCLVSAESVGRIALSFSACPTLSTVSLDYNEFGDDGCRRLHNGLVGNKTLLSLSLCYCQLKTECGKLLGDTVATTAIRELYVDGNDLKCEGAIELIKMCVDRAEEEAYLREEEARKKAEEEALAAMGKGEQKRVLSAMESGSGSENSPTEKKDKKKSKGKKKKKKKEPPAPPPVGPWLSKLHLADNSIDGLCEGGQIAPLICMKLFRRYLSTSKCLEELDLEDNLIGDMGGRELLEGLQERKEAGLGGVKIRTTHRMNADTFNAILKLGTGLKKKKKKGRKKKK